MKVTHVCKDDSREGASRSAHRVHVSLNRAGIDSTFLVRKKISTDPSVQEVDRFAAADIEVPEERFFDSFLGEPPSYWGPHRYSKVIQRFYLDANRTPLTNTIFTFGSDGYSLAKHETILNADIINLHWIVGLLSTNQIGELISLNKPVVWTLHDQSPMTGGCHYAIDCKQFESQCTGSCPQLRLDPVGLVEASFNDKLAVYGDGAITVVAPSRWIGEQAKKSRIFSKARVEVIPYGLDLESFSPMSQDLARQALGIPKDCYVLLFGCSSADESRKGGKFLESIVATSLKHPEFRSLVEADRVMLLFTGWNSKLVGDTIKLPQKHLGFINTDAVLRQAFSASDILFQLSTEDNLPNFALEAMACGTPIVGWGRTGINDIVVPSLTGELVNEGDISALANKLIKILTVPNLLTQYRFQSRMRIEQNFSLELQASRYESLYGDLLKQSRSRSVPYSQNVAKIRSELLMSSVANLARDIQEKLKNISHNADEIRRLNAVLTAKCEEITKQEKVIDGLNNNVESLVIKVENSVRELTAITEESAKFQYLAETATIKLENKTAEHKRVEGHFTVALNEINKRQEIIADVNAQLASTTGVLESTQAMLLAVEAKLQASEAKLQAREIDLSKLKKKRVVRLARALRLLKWKGNW